MLHLHPIDKADGLNRSFAAQCSAPTAPQVPSLPKSKATSDNERLIFKDVSGQCALCQFLFFMSLFTSIPVNESIDLCEQRLLDDDSLSDRTSLDVPTIVLVDVATKN